MDEMIVIGVLIGFILVAAAALIPVFKTLIPIYPYAYANARLRAMKNKLISEEEFEELSGKPYNEIIYQLEKKDYPNLSEFLGADFSYASVDGALRSSIIRTLGKVKRMTPDELKKFVDALVSKYDLQLIESLIRSSHSSSKIRRDIVHVTDVFSDEFLARKQHSIDELYNELKDTYYGPTLQKHLDALKKGEYRDCEVELDMLFYKRLLHHATTPSARRYVKYLIDMQNVSLLFKGIDALLEGGRIPLESLDAKMSFDEIKSAVNKHGYKTDGATASAVEKDLQIGLKRFGQSLRKQNPLSEATIVGFIILKTVNVRNLNILLKLKYHEYEKEEIMKVLAL